ncbi:STXB protein, partial [Polyodon spathula]|nr:STXB protein [Polyodon spathula]
MDTLNKDVDLRSQHNTEFQIIASDSIEDKSSALNIEASLKASFLGGLVEVKGSAKYLKDTKSSKQQARVTLHYRTTTKFMQLTMKQLGRGNVQHPYVFDQGIATHVVTAVFYGAQAFFVFDRDVSSVVFQFPEIGKKIKHFKDMCLEYKLVFQKKLAEMLPSIRGGGQEESRLADILRNKEQSPFKTHFLGSWLECKMTEMNVLRMYISLMKDIKMLSSKSEHDMAVLDHKAKYVLCFAFTSLCQEETYISDLSNYLRNHSTLQDLDSTNIDYARHEEEQWFSSQKVSEKMRERAKLFLDFAEANKDNSNTRFIAASVYNKDQSGAAIYLYEEGFKKSDCFEPPSKPEKPVVCGVTHDSVTLKIQPSQYGLSNLVQYIVEYSVPEKDEWKSVETSNKEESYTVSGLLPNTLYQFKCKAVCRQGVSKSSDTSNKVKTQPTSPPGQPSAVQIGSAEMTIGWLKPAVIGAGVSIDSYTVEYKEMRDSASSSDCADMWIKKRCENNEYTLKELKPETTYAIRLFSNCAEAGTSSQSVEGVLTTQAESKRLADKIQRQSELVNSGSPSIYTVPLQEVNIDKDGNCKRCFFGKENKRNNKTVIVVGATGAGKSTLINGMINYILGVKWDDGFRFKLINEGESKSQAESQTSVITAYEIGYQAGLTIPYSVTIIDTPGFGDTRGITRDRMITEQIRQFFSIPSGVDTVDAVCFVTQASLARLTQAQKYVFDSILSIFGKDIAENILMLVTFADGQTPPVLEAIKVSGVPCPKKKNGIPVHFKFNNSALFADKTFSEKTDDVNEDCDDDDDGGDNFDRMFWKMGVKSMKNFFDSLVKLQTKSLCLTKEVLKERKHLEVAVEGLQPQVQVALSKLDEIRKTRQIIEQHEAELSTNKDFEFEVELIKPVQEKITNHFITNCQQCHFTCHYPCAIPNDNDKRGCASMDSNGNCTACPGKCHWSIHFNQKYKWTYINVKEKRTAQDLKNKYEKAYGAKLSAQQIIEKQSEEIQKLEEAVISLIDESSRCLARLQEIALKPNPLSTPEYIELLIEGEKEEAKPGYMDRIKALQKMKEQALIIAKVFRKEKPNQAQPDRKQEDKSKAKKGIALWSWITGSDNSDKK